MKLTQRGRTVLIEIPMVAVMVIGATTDLIPKLFLYLVFGWV